VTLREAEEQERRQALEMRRLREELAAAQGRLVAALQAVQVANAEADALRASATTAVHDEQVRDPTLGSAHSACAKRSGNVNVPCMRIAGTQWSCSGGTTEDPNTG
jgi:hypothetical protein